MICGNCKREIPDGMRFCTHCGAPVSAAAGTESEDLAKTTVLETPTESPLDNTSPTMRVIPATTRTPARQSQVESHGEKRLLVVTSVMATLAVVAAIALAVVAAIALAVVILNPLGTTGTQGEAETQEPQGQISVNVNLPLDEKDDEAAEQDASEDDVTAPESDEPYEDENPDYDGYYVLPDSATHLYMGDELAAMSDWELYIARNEIFARHGRTFQKEDLQGYFDGQEWYEPRYSPDEFDAMVDTLLNDTERANASTILSIEQERGSAYV